MRKSWKYYFSTLIFRTCELFRSELLDFWLETERLSVSLFCTIYRTEQYTSGVFKENKIKSWCVFSFEIRFGLILKIISLNRWKEFWVKVYRKYFENFLSLIEGKYWILKKISPKTFKNRLCLTVSTFPHWPQLLLYL